ncbi:MAG: YihY/virulence factor BrkB family protein [Defluviitaleaceae bacterium]|nr:YihY/virulence factor BrkB family protein [Defluviitaleaceae bacterium]
MKNFLIGFYKDVVKFEIFTLATQLTYRLVFAVFPFLIFLISLVGFFNIDTTHLLQEVYALFPSEVAKGISDIIGEVVDFRSPTIMSLALLLSLFTVVNGFKAIMRGVNRCYSQDDNRHFVKQWLICALLVVILAFAIILSLLAIIFGDAIKNLLLNYLDPSTFFDVIFGIGGFAITLAVMLVAIMLIYHFASSVRHRFITLLPGAALTIVVWALSAWGFNIYVNNFANFSVIYGSIASVFLLMLWLNIISVTILLGSLLNAKLRLYPFQSTKTIR